MYFHIHMILDVFVIILANFQKIFSAKLGQEIRELTRSDLSETGQRWGARARGGLEPGVSTISGPARRRKTTTCAVADSHSSLEDHCYLEVSWVVSRFGHSKTIVQASFSCILLPEMNIFFYMKSSTVYDRFCRSSDISSTYFNHAYTLPWCMATWRHAVKILDVSGMTSICLMRQYETIKIWLEW